jgi:hypothetical protein
MMLPLVRSDSFIRRPGVQQQGNNNRINYLLGKRRRFPIGGQDGSRHRTAMSRNSHEENIYYISKRVMNPKATVPRSLTD